MAVTIGKRKRPMANQGSDADSEDENAMRALFQKAFEAKFKPLPQTEPHSEPDEQTESGSWSDDQEDHEEWDGLSDEDETIQIVNHDQSRSDHQLDQQHERKMFMSSKPPSAAQSSTRVVKKEAEDAEDDSTEKANLKNDLALQRLLKESHLLAPTSFSGRIAAPEGKSRLKSLDLRLQDLGAKKSIAEQQNMPLSHRKGISAKVASRQDKRRKEAVENGIVLEKAKSAVKSTKRRERSVGGPAVGKFTGGTLKLSSRDVKSIQGPKRRNSDRRKGRR